jgi:hypothetical protein
LAIGGVLVSTLSQDPGGPFQIGGSLLALVGFARCTAYWRRFMPKLGLPSFLGGLFMSYSFWLSVLPRLGFMPNAVQVFVFAIATMLIWIGTFAAVDRPR